ncbi:MAG TPA: hypothetical protein VE546_16800 [Streptomyces sp.]|uniref:hypothetical protein n=1 Tax=Streptomyces sp. TaxID=1931 RepID=UPI002D565DFF|nr:hypothetical protein [Streptomyces sp.]HZG05202.1 hypothetical protein [Streptomyces sp.]
MPQTESAASGETSTSAQTATGGTEHRGRHRGQAAVGEEARVPALGRHRRPALEEQDGLNG